MSHNTDARDTIIRMARHMRDYLPTWSDPRDFAEIIRLAESMTLDDDPPTYDATPVSGDPEPPTAEPPREQLRRACIDLTRLADELGWEWSIESCDAGGGRWVYRIEVDGLKEGGG